MKQNKKIILGFILISINSLFMIIFSCVGAGQFLNQICSIPTWAGGSLYLIYLILSSMLGFYLLSEEEH